MTLRRSRSAPCPGGPSCATSSTRRSADTPAAGVGVHPHRDQVQHQRVRRGYAARPSRPGAGPGRPPGRVRRGCSAGRASAARGRRRPASRRAGSRTLPGASVRAASRRLRQVGQSSGASTRISIMREMVPGRAAGHHRIRACDQSPWPACGGARRRPAALPDRRLDSASARPRTLTQALTAGRRRTPARVRRRTGINWSSYRRPAEPGCCRSTSRGNRTWCSLRRQACRCSWRSCGDRRAVGADRRVPGPGDLLAVAEVQLTDQPRVGEPPAVTFTSAWKPPDHCR